MTLVEEKYVQEITVKIEIVINTVAEAQNPKNLHQAGDTSLQMKDPRKLPEEGEEKAPLLKQVLHQIQNHLGKVKNVSIYSFYIFHIFILIFFFSDHRKSEKAPIKVPEVPPSPRVIEKKFEIDLFDIPARPEIFEQINADEFVPKLFAPKKLPDSIKIDLVSQTISVPKVESAETQEDALFHKNVRILKIFKH